jgi:hypothetical protein
MQATRSLSHRHFGLQVLAVLAALCVTAVLALGVAPSEAGARTSMAGSLSGSTSQGNPGRITVSSSGLMIKQASITVSVKCAIGPLLVPMKPRSVAVTPQGRFKATAEDAFTEEGLTVHLFESFSGKFNADRTSVVAKARIYVNFQDPTGAVETCDSGTVTLHARR